MMVVFLGMHQKKVYLGASHDGTICPGLSRASAQRLPSTRAPETVPRTARREVQQLFAVGEFPWIFVGI